VGACGALDVGTAELGAVEVSVDVVLAAGVVEVLLDGSLDVVVWEPAPDSAAAASEEPSLGSGAPVVPVAPNAAPASGPPRPAAVNPPPARADIIARRALRRARFKGGIRGYRSSRGRPIAVVGAASPQTRGTPTGILIGSEP
jgi:hypothetical protein